MIKQLTLQQFQSHKATTLNFRPGVNLIVGESDSGKSAILRGLRWLVFNRPSGFTFKSHWAAAGDNTEVTAHLSDGSSVTRLRNKKDNQYILDGWDSPLEAVRTDVPVEAKDALRMDELNVQRQGDKPYLLDDPPAEVARVLNMVAGLESIDAAHTRVAGKVRDNQASQRQTDTALADTQARLERYAGLAELQGKIAALARMQGQLKAQTDKATALSRLIEQAEELRGVLENTATVDVIETALVKVEQADERLRACRVKEWGLGELVQNVGCYKYRMDCLLPDHLRVIGDDLSAVEEQAAAMEQAETAVALLGALGKEARGYLDAMAVADAEIARVSTALEAYNTCPECGAEKRYWAK